MPFGLHWHRLLYRDLRLSQQWAKDLTLPQACRISLVEVALKKQKIFLCTANFCLIYIWFKSLPLRRHTLQTIYLGFSSLFLRKTVSVLWEIIRRNGERPPPLKKFSSLLSFWKFVIVTVKEWTEEYLHPSTQCTLINVFFQRAIL